jgi:hypothetical protein
MKRAATFILAMGTAVTGCAPYPVYVSPAPTPLLAATGWQLDQCTVIRREIARQQAIAASSGVMASLLVEGAVRINAANVIAGLETKAAVVGCPM